MAIDYLPNLPDLEETLVELVLELLRAPVQYPNLVLSQSVDPRGEIISPDAVRITHHYVSALLAFGYKLTAPELQQAREWFLAPLQREQAIVSIDPTEMNRLESLLALCPLNADFVLPDLVDFIMPRLRGLMTQRMQSVDGDNWGSFVIHSDNPPFDNVWALKAMCMAHERSILRPDMMSAETLRAWLDRLLIDIYKDKDLALALRLRYDLYGRSLKRAQRKFVDKLIKLERGNNGVWDLRNDLAWLVRLMHDQELTPGDVAEVREPFREMIVSTCYVIENLMPLVYSYPQVIGAIQEAVELWWGQLRGRGAADKLHELFPEPYDYLLVLTRTIVAVCSYAGAYSDEPLAERMLPHVYRALARQAQANEQSRELVNIQQALRQWVPLDIVGKPKKLKLGLSGANVARITPRLANPMDPDYNLSFIDSLIVKYGPIEEIDAERRNYARLPQAIRDCFVDIPQDSFIDREEGRAYVIMADLVGYVTLYEQLPTIGQMRNELLAELGPFLMRMHQGGSMSVQRTAGLLSALYLLPIQEHTGRIFNFLRDQPLLNEAEKAEAESLYGALNQVLGRLIQEQGQFGRVPSTYMHGDLHSRNIMVRARSRRAAGAEGRRLDFKLIDLEKFESAGDAAFDAGLLLVDLGLARARTSDNDASNEPLGALINRLVHDYVDFGEARGDARFGARMQLSMAHALLRISKGRVKLAETLLHQESRKAPAIDIAREIVGYARQSLDHLNAALEAV